MSTNEYIRYALRRARVCSIDALHALKCGRPDIAAQLRQARDVYMGNARFAWLKTA